MFLRNCARNLSIKRQMHGNAEIIENCKEIRNRNPRNLERLRIARKPIGYVLDNFDLTYWNKLIVHYKRRYIVAEINHFQNGAIITVSSDEWGLNKQLYSATDQMAHIAVGQVLAQRCLESGITEIYVPKQMITGPRLKSLVQQLEEKGILTEEPKRYKPWLPWGRTPEEKPWESYE